MHFLFSFAKSEGLSKSWLMDSVSSCKYTAWQFHKMLLSAGKMSVCLGLYWGQEHAVIIQPAEAAVWNAGNIAPMVQLCFTVLRKWQFSVLRYCKWEFLHIAVIRITTEQAYVQNGK